MTKYITFNKGTIDKLPTLEKRARLNYKYDQKSESIVLS